MDIWFFIWIALMLGLIIATGVAALREKKARASAATAMQPQPMGEDLIATPEAADDGFGDAADPMSNMQFDK